ncbi:MAG: single-stranded DNA-binding protein [Candidatus Hydrogenedentes bacterium]|nr:single-stranded DNA-binding protein [Candidatus Hydrogenedentota bacterium]
MADLRVPDLNMVVIAGRLTADPELRYLPSGLAVCTLRIANSRFYKKQDGSRGEDTNFVNVTVWDKYAEFVNDKLRKGRPVLVEGSLKSSSWEDKTTGQTRSKLEINARRVSPLDWDDNPAGGGGGGTSRPPQQYGSQPQPREIEEPLPEDDIPF